MSNLTIDHAKYRLDFTLSFDTRTHVFLNSKDFVENELFLEFQSEFEEILHNKCENWVYQVESTRWTSKEEDDEFLTNNLHIQGRLNLRTKMRSSTFEKQLKEELGTHHLLFYKMWFRPTSQNCRDFSYVMKPQTRLAGPFANKNLYLGLSILPPDKLLIWHERYIKKLENYNFQVNDAFFRHIYNVVDTKGHCQKTALSKHLIHYYENDVSFLDVWSSPVQLQNSIIAEGPKKLYFFDIPCKFLQGDRDWETSFS